MKMNKRGEKNLSIKSSHNEAKSLPQRALFVNLPSLTICQRDVIGQRRFGESFFYEPR